jgi:hypothetical protein
MKGERPVFVVVVGWKRKAGGEREGEKRPGKEGKKNIFKKKLQPFCSSGQCSSEKKI